MSDVNQEEINIYKIEKICTQTSADNFVKDFQLHKTYFLDGQWGSGKSEYLNEIEKSFKRDQNPNFQNLKIVRLKLWEKRTEKSIIKVFFHTVFPVKSFIIWLTLPISIVISLLATDQFNFGIESLMISLIGHALTNSILRIVTLITLIIAVSSVLKFKSDDLVYFILDSRRRSWMDRLFNLENKIIIVDDFDRIDSTKTQEEIYRIFNLLKNKTTFIFVGDYSKIYLNNQEGYLLKIIDKKCTLPYVLQAGNVWNKKIAAIGKSLNKDLSWLIALARKEMRSLRDLKYFLEVAEQEFIIKNKINRVNVSQQLYIIYLYIFDNESYSSLLSNPSEYVSDKKHERFINNAVYEKSNLLDILKSSEDNEVIPRAFLARPFNYFIREEVMNLSKEEVLDFFNAEKIAEIIKPGAEDDFPNYEDIKLFIESLPYKRTDELLQGEALEIVVKEFLASSSQLSELLVNKKYIDQFDRHSTFYQEATHPIYTPKIPDNIPEYFAKLNDVFKFESFDLSEKIYFLIEMNALKDLSDVLKLENPTRNEVIKEIFSNKWPNSVDELRHYKKKNFMLPFYFEDINNVTIEDWNEFIVNLSSSDFQHFYGYLGFSIRHPFSKDKIFKDIGSKVENEDIRDLFEAKINDFHPDECGG